MSEASERGGRSRPKRPKRGNSHDFFVVGIGASAGGITALERFFESMPGDSGMAFVVILHLSPEHESNLAAMLQRKTGMPVIQVVESVKVEPNHVYVIPPAKNLVMSDSSIVVQEPEARKGPRVPIDLFFRTLGAAYNIHAVGLVLSGTGTDGTLGLKRIKEEGGIALAQDLEEAEYDGMPRNAIDAGLVDFVLPVAEMPEKLIGIRQASQKIQIPPEAEKPPAGEEADALREILTLVRIRTGHDFNNYKPSTVLRRITRRMQVNEVNELSAYLQFMREHLREVEELQRDMLITVTNFFRDAEAFDILEQEVVPRLFEEKGDGDQVRVWVTGCATGEEAYSLAILLQEQAEKLDQALNIQIFATDIDDESIVQAREGVYPEAISADVPAERLKHYFTKEGQHYRVRKEIREMVLFAPHNILRDPPFSRLDLVSCRNLLIYLNRQTQDRVLEIFHFALRPHGFLFLGTSDSADSQPELFAPVDKKHRIFRRNAVSAAAPYVPAMPLPGRWDVKLPEVAAAPARKPAFSYGEIHQILVEQYAPPSVLVNEAHDIVHLSDHAGRYLRFAGGEPSRSLLKAVHPDLRLDLRAALFTAAQEGHEHETRRLSFKVDGETQLVKIIVRPVRHPELARYYLLVIFDEGAGADAPVPTTPPRAGAEGGGIDQLVRHLEDELQRTKSVLRATVEQYETSTEELKASNEELQAINEELHSATEELETSKEELQSLNEELQTVNSELNDKVNEVSRINSDLQNLLAATDVSTIFLDRKLRIKRYTPRVEVLFNIIPSDIGRPLVHLTHKLDYHNLSEDAGRVLLSLTTIKREVRSAENRWYIARLLPYRTVEDRIDGVVLTFIEITELKRAAQTLRDSEEHLRLLIEGVQDYAIFSVDPENRIISWNKGAEKIFGYTESEAVGQTGEIIFTPEDRGRGVPEEEIREAQNKGRADDNRWHVRKDGSRFFASGVMTPLRGGGGRLRGYVKITRDLTEQRQVEQERVDMTSRVEHERSLLEDRVKERTSNLESEVAERRIAEGRVKDLLRRVVSTQELERLRISRELHDLLGQQLTALRLNLESMKEHRADEAEMARRIEQAQAIARQLDEDVDFLAWEMRPAALDEFGFVTAIENYVQEWSKHFGIKAEYHTAGLGNWRLAPEVETSFYRIAQEALNNIYKHAEASRVDVLLERRNNNVVLIVEDNGKGFDPNDEATLRQGMGLVNMRERAALVGGTLEIESIPGKGTTSFVRIPLSLPENEDGSRKQVT